MKALKHLENSSRLRPSESHPFLFNRVKALSIMTTFFFDLSCFVALTFK